MSEAREAPRTGSRNTAGVSVERIARLRAGENQALVDRYHTRRDPESELQVRLRDLTPTRIRYGYRRLTVLLPENKELRRRRNQRVGDSSPPGSPSVFNELASSGFSFT